MNAAASSLCGLSSAMDRVCGLTPWASAVRRRPAAGSTCQSKPFGRLLGDLLAVGEAERHHRVLARRRSRAGCRSRPCRGVVRRGAAVRVDLVVDRCGARTCVGRLEADRHLAVGAAVEESGRRWTATRLSVAETGSFSGQATPYVAGRRSAAW